MALYTQAEFSRKCGVTEGYLNVYKKRGKVVVDKDGMVDDKDLMNAAFLEKCKLRVKSKPQKEKKPVKSRKSTKTEENSADPEKKSASERKVDADRMKKIDDRFALDFDKKKADLEKARREQNILAIKEARLMGQVIDKEMAMNLFIQQFKFFTKSFQNNSELLITDMSKKARLNRNQQAELRKTLIKMINDSVDQAVDDGQAHFRNIIQESSKAIR